MIKLFKENQTFNILKRDKAISLIKIVNEYYSPQIQYLNNDKVLFVKMAKKKIDIYKIGESKEFEICKVGQIFANESPTFSHQCDSLIFLGCMQNKIDVITAENFVKFKRFMTNGHPACIMQIN